MSASRFGPKARWTARLGALLVVLAAIGWAVRGEKHSPRPHVTSLSEPPRVEEEGAPPAPAPTAEEVARDEVETEEEVVEEELPQLVTLKIETVRELEAALPGLTFTATDLGGCTEEEPREDDEAHSFEVTVDERRQLHLGLLPPDCLLGLATDDARFSATLMTLMPGETSRLWAAPAHLLEVRVRDESGLPIRGARVKLSGSRARGGWSRELPTTDGAGLIRVERLGGGTVSLHVEAAGFGTWRKSVRLTERRTLQEVSLVPAAPLEIRLQAKGYHAGRPVQLVVRGENLHLPVTLDVPGGVTLEGVPEETLHFELHERDVRRATSEVLAVLDAGARSIELALEPRRLELNVPGARRVNGAAFIRVSCAGSSPLTVSLGGNSVAPLREQALIEFAPKGPCIVEHAGRRAEGIYPPAVVWLEPR